MHIKTLADQNTKELKKIAVVIKIENRHYGAGTVIIRMEHWSYSNPEMHGNNVEYWKTSH